MNFYSKFLQLCDAAGKKPSAVAEEAGLNRSQVTRWKQGKGFTDASALKLANYFGIPVEELTGEKETGPAKAEPVMNESERLIREKMLSSYAYRVLFDTANGAAESDLLEAAALIQKRKEERGL